MLDIFFNTPGQVVMTLAGLTILVIIGYYVVRRFRDQISDDQPMSSDLLTNFREMRQQGDINDEEYRTIKTVLGGRLRTEIKETDDKA